MSPIYPLSAKAYVTDKFQLIYLSNGPSDIEHSLENPLHPVVSRYHASQTRYTTSVLLFRTYNITHP